MIFEKKNYRTPGILQSLLFQGFFWVATPWSKLRKDCDITRESIRLLNQNKIPVLVNPNISPVQCLSCLRCAEVCPTQCLSLHRDDTLHEQSFKLNLLNCISCSKCVDSCPDKILVMQNVGLGPAPVESEWVLELIGFVPQ